LLQLWVCFFKNIMNKTVFLFSFFLSFFLFLFASDMGLFFKYNKLNSGFLWFVEDGSVSEGGGRRRPSHHRLKLLIPPGKLFFLSFLFHFRFLRL
jgi:hypothetical protein